METEKRHYEILLVLRHLQEDKADELIKKYKDLFNKDGEITRFENWGVRQLAYHIDGFSRALYVLFNVNCPGTTVEELEKLWKFDDMLLRHLIFRCKDAETEDSPILIATKSKSAREGVDENLDKVALRSEFQRGLNADANPAAVAAATVIAPAIEAGVGTEADAGASTEPAAENDTPAMDADATPEATEVADIDDSTDDNNDDNNDNNEEEAK